MYHTTSSSDTTSSLLSERYIPKPFGCWLRKSHPATAAPASVRTAMAKTGLLPSLTFSPRNAWSKAYLRLSALLPLNRRASYGYVQRIVPVQRAINSPFRVSSAVASQARPTVSPAFNNLDIVLSILRAALNTSTTSSSASSLSTQRLHNS